MKLIQVYEKSYHQHETHFFYSFEKAKYFCGKNIPIDELSSRLSASLGLHKPPNLELIVGNWQLASYQKIKYLESNLLCVNVGSLSVGKKHDIVG